MAVSVASLAPHRSISYRRLLVPVADGAASAHAIAAACRLAAEHGASIAGVAVIEIPANLPIDSHMTEEETEAGRLLDKIEATGDLYGLTVDRRILRSRQAGEALVDAATRSRTEVIVLGALRRKRADRRAPMFGRTVDFVLKHAPCRVMVLVPPVGA